MSSWTNLASIGRGAVRRKSSGESAHDGGTPRSMAHFENRARFVPACVPRSCGVTFYSELINLCAV